MDKLTELALKAGLHKEWYIDFPVIEKFAELIVKECAAIAKKEQHWNDTHSNKVNIDQCIILDMGVE